ncbi:PAS domain S-box protein [Nitrospira sp. Nam74]
MESQAGRNVHAVFSQSLPVRSAPPCVLIVDDDPDIRQALSDMLEAEGYGIHAVGTGAEGIAQAGQVFYGVVLLDIGLPDLDGHAVLRAIREVDATLPVIILTGYGSEHNTIGPLSKGALAYLTKPYRPVEIKALVRRAMEVRAMALKAQTVEFALNESQERFRSVFQSSSDAIVLADDDGHIVSWNRSAERMFGYVEADMLGKSVSVLLPSRYQERFVRGLENYRADQFEAFDTPIEIYGRRRDESEFPVEVSVSTWTSAHQRFFGAIIRDITTRRLIEQRRAAEYEVTRVLAESATLADAAPKILQTICESLSWDMGLLWGVDEPDELLRCLHLWRAAEGMQAPFEIFSQQHAFRRGIGLPGRVWASAQPLWVTDVQHDDNFPRAPSAIELGLHSALAFPLKLHGHVVGVLECFSHHIRQPDDDLLQMLGAIGSQIGQFTERTRAQAALDKAYAKMEAILVSMPCALLIVESNERIMYSNPIASRYFSSEGASLIGRNLSEVFSDTALNWNQVVANLRTAAYQTEPLPERDIEIRKRTYRYRPFVVGEPEREWGAVGLVLWDTTEHQQLQDQLIQAEKLASLGTLVSGMAHEVNNPIQGIMSMAEIIVHESDLEKVKEYARDIVTYSEHVGVVVKDFACYARPASRDQEVDLDINERLGEALKLVQRSAQFGHIMVTTTFRPLPVLRARRSEIDQIFVNIINNAVDAMGGRGRLTLETEWEDETMRIHIRDTGSGIPPALVGKIFDPFMTTKDPGKGTGLGLSIAYKIVSKYEGGISVESEEGKGTAFTIKFPISTKHRRSKNVV